MDDTNNAKGNESFGDKMLSENEDSLTQNLIEENYEPESSLEELLIEDEVWYIPPTRGRDSMGLLTPRDIPRGE